jgi:Ser/Thr protein kinase RdoA (MazF antagonist)
VRALAESVDASSGLRPGRPSQPPANDQRVGQAEAAGNETPEALLCVARAALDAYDLPPQLGVRPIRLLNNAVFEVVGDGVHLALRVHRPGYRSVEQVRSELSILEMLDDEMSGSSVAVPRPVRARSGERLVCVGGQDEDLTTLYCDVLSWVDGRVLRHGRGLGRRSTFLLGEGLARLHNATQRLAASDELELPQWDANAMFSEASPFRPGPMDDFLAPEAWTLFQSVVGRTSAVFEEIGRSREQWGIIHNDYVLINCHFQRPRHGWNLAVLDFDDVGWGYFLYDLAPLLGNLFDWPDAYSQLRRAFLDGYRSVRALPAELECHLPVLMAARHAASLTWLAAKQRRGETDVPIERQVEIRVGEMKRCLALKGD